MKTTGSHFCEMKKGGHSTLQSELGLQSVNDQQWSFKAAVKNVQQSGCSAERHNSKSVNGKTADKCWSKLWPIATAVTIDPIGASSFLWEWLPLTVAITLSRSYFSKHTHRECPNSHLPLLFLGTSSCTHLEISLLLSPQWCIALLY